MEDTEKTEVRDLSDLSGSWSQEAADEFDASQEIFEEIDAELWADSDE